MSEYKLEQVDAIRFHVYKDGKLTYNIRFKGKAWSCDCPARKECRHLKLLPPEVLVKRFSRELLMQAINDMKFLLPAKFEVCGSYRRGEPTSKDIDILVQCMPEEFLKIKQTLAATGGEKKIIGMWDDIPYDLERVEQFEWASHLLYRTGSKVLNIKMRQIAKDKGWILNEHGILKPDGLWKYDTEEAIFNELGMNYLPPTDRSLK